MRTLLRSERGQAMVETAIVMPILILVMFSALDAGRIFNVWIAVTNGAREGARAAATRQTEDEVRDHIAQAMTGVPYSSAVITTTDGVVPGPSGSPVTVELTSEVTMLTPVISQIFGAVVHVSSSSTMRLE